MLVKLSPVVVGTLLVSDVVVELLASDVGRLNVVVELSLVVDVLLLAGDVVAALVVSDEVVELPKGGVEWLDVVVVELSLVAVVMLLEAAVVVVLLISDEVVELIAGDVEELDVVVEMVGDAEDAVVVDVDAVVDGVVVVVGAAVVVVDAVVDNVVVVVGAIVVVVVVVVDWQALGPHAHWLSTFFMLPTKLSLFFAAVASQTMIPPKLGWGQYRLRSVCASSGFKYILGSVKAVVEPGSPMNREGLPAALLATHSAQATKEISVGLPPFWSALP